MAFNSNWANAGGQLGSGLADWFSDWQNPADKANPYFDQMPDILKKYMEDYVNAGKRQIPGLESEYGRMVGDPGGFINQVGQGYQKSPGFDWAMKQALQGANHAAAAGGMAGSPQHELESQEIATNLANQDYNNWLKTALGQHGLGLAGEQSIFNTGAQTGGQLGQDLASIMAQQALLAYLGQEGENKRSGNMWGNILGGIGTIGGGSLGGMVGGPVGAGIGSSVGGSLGGKFADAAF